MPIPVTDLIDTTAPSDTYATHNSVRGKGGLHEVSDRIARNSITIERRTEGMLAYVRSEGVYYTLQADLTTWTALMVGGDTYLADLKAAKNLIQTQKIMAQMALRG